MRDGKGTPQGKCWETAGAAEQETCWWERTKCRRVRCLQKKKKMEKAETPRKYQFNIWLRKSASRRKQPKRKPAGRKSLETVTDEFCPVQ